MSARIQRLILIFFSLVFFSFAITLILINSKKNLVFFYTPSEFYNQSFKNDMQIRIGGIVKKNSIIYKTDDTYFFILNDKKNEIKIKYIGILPDLFKEEKGAVVEGKYLYTSDLLIASKVYSKHDENYMPASLQNQLEKNNYWKRNY